MKPNERIIFALDVSTEDKAWDYVTKLQQKVGAFKVGLELFIAAGPRFVRNLTDTSSVMLDLKLHDIPETVERAISSAGDLGVKFLTLHVQQRRTLEGAVRAAEKYKIQLLGVTVLTSMSDSDCVNLMFDTTPQDGILGNITAQRAYRLAQLASSAGITGFVASPLEVANLRKAFPKATLVIPGIRPLGTGTDDQKRVGTPADAVRDGADYLVIGRPIRDAEDPAAAAAAIAAEIIA